MKFRTSWFNPTLAAHHWKRGWPLPLIMLLWCLFLYMMSFANQISYWKSQAEIDLLTSFYAELKDIAATLPPLLACGAIAAALIIFRYLHKRTASQFYLTMPMKRRCSWLSGVVSGWMMAIVPMVITILFLMILSAVNGIPVVPVLHLLLFGICCWTISYALAVISCILAGNCFGSMLIYLGINCALYILETCAERIASWVITGYAGTAFLEQLVLWLTPVAKLESCIGGSATELSMAVPLVYLTSGVILLGLSGVLYQKRPSENAGETVAFRQLRSLCKIAGALLVCVTGAILIESCIYLENGFSFPCVFCIVLGCLVIGWFAAAMIIRRTFRVFDRREFTGLTVTAALILVLLIGGKMDIFGYVTKVPDLACITAAEVECGSVTVELEPEELLDIHETILAHPDEIVPSSAAGIAYTVNLFYTLNNGAQLKRSYNLPAYYVQTDGEDTETICMAEESAICNKIVEILSVPQNNLQTWFPDWPDVPDFSQLVFADVTIYENSDVSGSYIPLSAQQAQRIYDAFLQDLEAGNVQPALMTDFADDSLINIELALGNTAYTESLIPPNEDAVYYTEEYLAQIYLKAPMVNTIATLEGCGINTDAAFENAG